MPFLDIINVKQTKQAASNLAQHLHKCAIWKFFKSQITQMPVSKDYQCFYKTLHKTRWSCMQSVKEIHGMCIPTRFL